MRFVTRSRNKQEIADMSAARQGGIVCVERAEDWSCFTGGGWYEEASPFSVEAWNALKTNCKNCGAPYEPIKCSYCGTHHSA